jgi:hypothetical protein
MVTYGTEAGIIRSVGHLRRRKKFAYGGFAKTSLGAKLYKTGRCGVLEATRHLG